MRFIFSLTCFAMLLNCSSPCDNMTFPRSDTSPYVLPYPVGEERQLSQSYCSPWGHKNRLAYDFQMEIGAPITNSRPGVVVETISTYSDHDHQPGHNNRVVVKHTDGTMGWYAHLQQGSIIVEKGDSVEYGDTLGACGQSGRAGAIPHLHFEVFKSKLYHYSDAMPITFSNIEGLNNYNHVLKSRVPLKARPY